MGARSYYGQGAGGMKAPRNDGHIRAQAPLGAGKTVFQSQMEDREAFDSLRRSGRLESAIRAAQRETSYGFGEPAGAGDLEAAMRNLETGAADLLNPNAAEAIIMLSGYPSLLIRNGDYEEPEEQVWRNRLDGHRQAIRNVFRSVGRVELKNHPQRIPWIGTCWLVDDDVFVTNRHVAEFFAEMDRGSPRLTKDFQVYVDFNEEIDAREQAEFLIGSLLYIEPFDSPADLAFMRLASGAARQLGAEPLALHARLPEVEYLGVAGYPADDPRNNPRDAFHRIFKDCFGVKRFAPGRVMNPSYTDEIFTHNCTTLGGNSGSVVFDIASGAAIGLHCGGNAQLQNYAVKAGVIADRMRRTQIPVHGPEAQDRGRRGRDLGRMGEVEIHAEDFNDRDGYRADFIGSGPLSAPTPLLSPEMTARAARAGDGRLILNYRHYSVVMSRPRRLAYFCASNIDGASGRRPPRPPRFCLDPRLPDDAQTGEDMYRHNDLDRGHLVRRLDPCWGDREEAEQANRDTMFFPNIVPQHKDLNQKIWLELEDHILGMTEDAQARICVFVGCIFSENDPVQKPSGVKVPMAFWKVIASAGRAGGRGRQAGPKLQAQAFVMSQQKLVKPDDLEIVFGGGFETFQVTVEQLERMTGLDFQNLKEADTFQITPEQREALFGTADFESACDPMRNGRFKVLNSLDDIEF
jgi:endonuclease G